MADYTSSIKKIAAPQSRVYERLGDLRGLEQVSSALKGRKETEGIEIREVDVDYCTFYIPMAGELTLRVVEREPEKTIKLEADHSSIPLTLWIQLLDAGVDDTRLRLTLRAELNFMMKTMLGGKLEKGVEKLADMMATIPY